MKLTIQELSKAFGSRDIFSNFSLDVESGERLCVCGPNGSGKSTFLKMLAGKEDLDSGRIILPKGCRLGFVEQELSVEDLQRPLIQFVLDALHDWSDFWKEWERASVKNDEAEMLKLMERQTELEHIFGYNPEQRAREVLTGLGFSEKKLTQPLGELSGGWRERAKLARVLTQGADVLLLDEPTNHLDMDAVEWLESFLLSFKGALIFVAHDRVFMDKVGTSILYLGMTKPVYRKTVYSKFLAQQEEYEQQRERTAKALQEEYERKMAFVERFRAKATKARQAASRQKMAKKIEKELEDFKPEPKRRELNLSWPDAPHSEKVMLTASDLAFHFPDGTTLWEPLTFTLYRESRIALVGHNGSGKSTLLKLLAGRLEPVSGSIARASQMRLGYFTQHQMDTLNPDATVLAEIRRLSDPHTTEEELMSVLGLFLLGQNYFERKVASLSGGEKSRLVLASLFLARCNFLLLDEPTNHLDLESREALAKALQNYSGALLMVAHDRWLLNQVNAEIWDLSRDGIRAFDNFAAFEAAKKNQDSLQNPPEIELSNNVRITESQAGFQTPSREEQKKRKRLEAEQRNALHKELKPLEKRYSSLETELNEKMERQGQVERDLADPDIYADRAKSGALLSEFENLRSRMDAIMTDMDFLEKEMERIRRDREDIKA